MQYIVKMSQVVFWALVTICVSVVVTSLVVSAYWRLQGGAVLAVQTGSMVPTFAPGDALVIRHVNTAHLHIGEIVSYGSQLEPGAVISHRIVSIDSKAKTVTTKGDHINQPDTPVAVGAVRGRAVALLPKFGYALSALHRPLGLSLFVYLPAIGIICYELNRFNKQVAVHYILAGYQTRH